MNENNQVNQSIETNMVSERRNSPLLAVAEVTVVASSSGASRA
jgi:hypothetical protein